jgi:hypothetical protein
MLPLAAGGVQPDEREWQERLARTRGTETSTVEWRSSFSTRHPLRLVTAAHSVVEGWRAKLHGLLAGAEPPP